MERRIRNIIKAANLSSSISAGAVVAINPKRNDVYEPPEPVHNCEPAITLHRDGDLIEAIEVTCGCGQTTFVQCLYEGASS